MNLGDDPLSAFGSIEEGDDPLLPFIDPMLFDTLDKQAQVDLLAPAFDALTLAGVDFNLTVEDSNEGKRYILLRDEKVIAVLTMDSSFTDKVLAAINKKRDDS